jgi:hypothetical protein
MIQDMKRRFQSGDVCPESGWYEFDGYVESPFDPLPALDEMEVRLSAGTAFPAIRNTNNRACFWILAAGAPTQSDVSALARL